LHHTAAEALRCFACHCSYVPVEKGRIDFDRLITGVNCTRCHEGAAQHLAAEGSAPAGVAWKSLSALDSINRCGECHRRGDEFTSDELTPDNKLLLRFAPVGLSQSPCFQAQGASPGERMDCLTCHNPHRPAATDPAFYAQRCLQCHQPEAAGHVSCPIAPQGNDCLRCHMPKVSVSEGLSFTDHWIRVRDQNAAAGR
jgi:hypothetical protein